MIAADLQSAAFSLLADNTDKLSQTADSTAIGSIQSGDVLENGYMLWSDGTIRLSRVR